MVASPRVAIGTNPLGGLNVSGEPGIDVVSPLLTRSSDRRRSGGTRGSEDEARPRRRGRPIEMAPETVLERIQLLATRDEGLFRVHRTHPALYARARRLFGSWEGAVRASGLDYPGIVARAFERAAQSRRRSPRRPVVTLP
jgi:hypothetical protein